MDIKFTIGNKRNVVFISIIVLIVLLFFFLVYLPKLKECKDLTAKYKKIRSDMTELYSFIGGESNLKDNIIDIRERLHLLEKAFPSELEVSDVIKQLNDKARHFNVDVISLKPGNIGIYRDSNGKEVKISGCFCKSMPLTLKLESRYQALGEFLMTLEMNKTPMVSVQKIDIEKQDNVKPKVKAEVNLTAYIIGK